MPTLDVGCGDKPTGDVNLDRYYYGLGKNFVVANVPFFPFKDNTFDKIYARHCLEHFDNPYYFFKEARRVLRSGGTLECTYPTDTFYTKISIHNLLNLRLSSFFKWKSKIIGAEKINFGGHKWQFSDKSVNNLLKKNGFTNAVFDQITFPTIRRDLDPKEKKWKNILNIYLPKWQLDTRFVAQKIQN